MKNLVKYLFILSFLWVSGHSFSQTSVKPVKKEFFQNDTLSFIFNGVIRNDGANKLNPVWGVLRRATNGWDTLIHVRSRIMMKEIIPYTSFENYKRDFIVIDNAPILYTDDRLYPEELLFNNDGEYKLTVLSGDGREVIYSEPFVISTKITNDAQLAKQLRLSPDTLTIGNNQFILNAGLWRDMSQIPKGGQTNCYSELTEINDLLPDTILLTKQYVINGDEIWTGDFERIKKTKKAIEARVSNGPKWPINSKVDVICEFEYLEKTYRIIAKSRLIGGIE